MDDQTLLDAVNTQILALLNGGAVAGWKEGGHEVQHMSLMDLYALKQQLENRLAQSSGSICLPVVSRDI